MTEPIAGYGQEAGLCGSPDGDTWEKILTVDGVLQVDTVSTGNPSNLDIAISALRDALAGASPNTSTLYALNTLLTEIQARLGDETTPAAGTVNKQLADILTELEAKLETNDLGLDGSGRLSVNQHQYDGAAWRKSNLLWGYNDIVSEAIVETNLPAGASDVVGTTVPSGEVWCITAVSGMVLSATISSLYFSCYSGTGHFFVRVQTPPATGVWYAESGTFYLKAGWTVRARVVGATAGDDCYLRYFGYKMNVEM